MDYLQQKRNELNFKKINTIQQFIVSLTDRILQLVADMNIRLNYIMTLVLRLKTPQDKYK
jgi:hypothetical protein